MNFEGQAITPDAAAAIRRGEAVTTWRALHADPRPAVDECVFLRRALHVECDRQRAMQRALAAAFGAARGWTLSETTFGLVTLARGKQHSGRRYDADDYSYNTVFLDHPYYYRRHRKAAAIAAHLYSYDSAKAANCRAYAADHGLLFEEPDFPS